MSAINQAPVDNNQRLLDCILAGDVQGIKNWKGDWNFSSLVEGRSEATTPLCCLCRPELINALPNLSLAQRIDLIKHAIAEGASLAFPRERAYEAVSEVVLQGRVEVLRTLLKELTPQILRDYRHHDGSNLLHLAAHGDRYDMTEFLVDQGLDVNWKNHAGHTPLFWCFSCGMVSSQCARLLYSQNADPFEVDPRSGASPFSLSIRSAPDFAKDLLQEKGLILANRLNAELRRFNFTGIILPSNPRQDTEAGQLVFSDQVDGHDGGWADFSTPRLAAMGEWIEHLEGRVLKESKDYFKTRGAVEAALKRTDQVRQSERVRELRQLISKLDEARAEAVPHKLPRSYKSKIVFTSAIGLMIKHKRRELLMTPIMRQVLDIKWNGAKYTNPTTGKVQKLWGLNVVYYTKVIIYLVFIAAIFGATSFWPTLNSGDPVPVVVYICMAVSILAKLPIFVGELLELSRLGFKAYFGDWQNIVDLFILLFYGTLIITMAERVVSSPHDLFAPRITYAGSLLAVCFAIKMLEFGSIPRRTGPLVASTVRMVSDMVEFFKIFSVFYFAFIFALWPTFDTAEPRVSLPALAIKVLVWMLGDWDLSDFEEIQHEPSRLLARGLFIGYILICSVLLLNMVIAMMGNTFNEVVDDAEGQWQLNRAQHMLTLDLTRPPFALKLTASILEQQNNKESQHFTTKYREDTDMEMLRKSIEFIGSTHDRELRKISQYMVRELTSLIINGGSHLDPDAERAPEKRQSPILTKWTSRGPTLRDKGTPLSPIAGARRDLRKRKPRTKPGRIAVHADRDATYGNGPPPPPQPKAPRPTFRSRSGLSLDRHPG